MAMSGSSLRQALRQAQDSPCLNPLGGLPSESVQFGSPFQIVGEVPGFAAQVGMLSTVLSMVVFITSSPYQ